MTPVNLFKNYVNTHNQLSNPQENTKNQNSRPARAYEDSSTDLNSAKNNRYTAEILDSHVRRNSTLAHVTLETRLPLLSTKDLQKGDILIGHYDESNDAVSRIMKAANGGVTNRSGSRDALCGLSQQSLMDKPKQQNRNMFIPHPMMKQLGLF